LFTAASWGAVAIKAEPVITGLASPVDITYAGDGSGRLFIVLQGGRIVIFDGVQILSPPFLDITSLVSSGGERGLLSAAFHPSYVGNGFFYVSYTDTAGASVIARYSVSSDPNRRTELTQLQVLFYSPSLSPLATTMAASCTSGLTVTSISE